MAGLLGSRQFRLTLIITGLVGWANSLPAQTDTRWLGSRMNDWYAEASRSAPGDWGIAVFGAGPPVIGGGSSVARDEPVREAAVR